MYKAHLTIAFLILGTSLIVSGCGPGKLFGTTLTPTSTITPTSTSTKTPTNTSTSTPTLTLTSTPTNTLAPLKLPVLNGTPVPQSNNPISIENVSKVTELARYWGNPESSVRVTRDEKFLAMVTAEGIYFFEVDSGKLINTLTASPISKDAFAISDNLERFAYIDRDKKVHVLDKKNQEVFTTTMKLSGKDAYSIPYDYYLNFATMELSPNGKFLAITLGGPKYGAGMFLFDVDTGERLPVTYLTAQVCFAGDGHYLVIRPNLIYDTSNWQKIPSPGIKLDAFDPFTCNPVSNQIAILSWNSPRVEVVDIDKSKSLIVFNLPDELTGKFKAADEIRFSSDGKNLIAMNGYAAYYNEEKTYAGLFDAGTGKFLDFVDSDNPAVYNIEQLSVSTSGKLIFISAGINPASLPRLDPYYVLSIPREPAYFLITGSGINQSVLIGSASTKSCEIHLNGNSECFPGQVYGQRHLWSDGIYYAYNDCEISLFSGQTLTGERLVSVKPEPGTANSCQAVVFHAISPKYKTVLYGLYPSGNTAWLVLYNYAEGKKITVLKLPTSSYTQSSSSVGLISPDGRYAAMLLDYTGTYDQIIIYDLSTQKMVLSQYLNDDFINNAPSLAFSGDSKLLFMVSPNSPVAGKIMGSIHIINLDGEIKQTRYVFTRPAVPSSFQCYGISGPGFTSNFDGSLLAISSGGCIAFIDTAKGTIIHGIYAHAGIIYSLALNDDGTLLASVERSGIVKIWGIGP